VILQNTAVPTIFDADALNLIAQDTEVLRRPHPELVITPHLGEMSRLCQDSVSYIQENLIEVAQEFAREYNVICVLKDAHSICAVPYGKTSIITSGHHGMATAGAGDVLTGIIAALIGMGMPPEEAASCGAYLHGAAGRAAALKLGGYSVTASDIVEQISEILKKVRI
jgi:NAD(P)H-hydrate epimerase